MKSPITLITIVVEIHFSLSIIHALGTHVGFHMAFVGGCPTEDIATGFALNRPHAVLFRLMLKQTKLVVTFNFFWWI